jgi:cytochrome b561
MLVTLHWVLALLIVAALTLGLFVLADKPNSDPRKIDILEVHRAGGMLILALMAVSWVVRLWTAAPPVAASGLSVPR